MYFEPLWCEDCKSFKCIGMDGEGECSKGEEDVWYARAVCDKFEQKDGDSNGMS